MHTTLPLAAALAGLLMMAVPALADSVAVGTANGQSATVTTNGRPCRVITGDDNNSTTITTGRNGLSGTTTVTPGGGSSVTVGSGSSSGPNGSASAGSGCVVTQPDRH